TSSRTGSGPWSARSPGARPRAGACPPPSASPRPPPPPGVRDASSSCRPGLGAGGVCGAGSSSPRAPPAGRRGCEGAAGTVCRARVAPKTTLFPVREATLTNGLRVRLVPDHDAPVASLYTFFQVGSRNERPGITGISHLFEHMMFNGAAKYGPKKFDEVLESSGGRSNAYTNPDVTVYYEDFAADALDTVLDLESDRMRSLTIDERSLAREREVVKEERRLRVENEPAGLMDEALHALVYQAHPYRWPVIGYTGDIEAIDRKDCEDYFHTFYAPGKAVLLLAGDFDPAPALSGPPKPYAHLPPPP